MQLTPTWMRGPNSLKLGSIRPTRTGSPCAQLCLFQIQIDWVSLEGVPRQSQIGDGPAVWNLSKLLRA